MTIFVFLVESCSALKLRWQFCLTAKGVDLLS